VGNSYTNWNKLTPRHNSFIQHILQSPSHIIGCIRSKQDYVLSDKNGKMVPEKVGLRGVTREGLDYEFTLVFELDINHNCRVTKDRTSVFADKPEFIITSETGKMILEWCNAGTIAKQPEQLSSIQIQQRIEVCKTIHELVELYKMHPQYQQSLLPKFTAKKQSLENKQIINQLPNSEAIMKF
jgi:hypothetical protein